MVAMVAGARELDTTGAARLLGIHPRTVRAWARAALDGDASPLRELREVDQRPSGISTSMTSGG